MKEGGGENEVYVIIEKSDDGFWMTVEDLPGCYSFGNNITEALSNTREAITDHISGLREHNEKIPGIFLADYTIRVKYDLQSLFDTYKIINKTALAEYVGINSSLLRQYAKGLAFASEKQREKIEKALHKIGEELTRVYL
jgi:predicted RNase H-like HicB family nuclease